MKSLTKFALLTALLLPICPLALANAPCTDKSDAKAAQKAVEATLAAAKEDQKMHEAAVEKEIKTRAAAASWNKDKQSKVFMDVLASPQFAAFEKEKQPYSMELMNIMMAAASEPKGPSAKAQCEAARRMTELMPKIKAVNAKQYAYMAAAVRAAK